jgi:hypothetical protein
MLADAPGPRLNNIAVQEDHGNVCVRLQHQNTTELLLIRGNDDQEMRMHADTPWQHQAVNASTSQNPTRNHLVLHVSTATLTSLISLKELYWPDPFRYVFYAPLGSLHPELRSRWCL